MTAPSGTHLDSRASPTGKLQAIHILYTSEAPCPRRSATPCGARWRWQTSGKECSPVTAAAAAALSPSLSLSDPQRHTRTLVTLVVFVFLRSQCVLSSVRLSVRAAVLLYQTCRALSGLRWWRQPPVRRLLLRTVRTLCTVRSAAKLRQASTTPEVSGESSSAVWMLTKKTAHNLNDYLQGRQAPPPRLWKTFC